MGLAIEKEAFITKSCHKGRRNTFTSAGKVKSQSTAQTPQNEEKKKLQGCRRKQEGDLLFSFLLIILSYTRTL